MGRVASELLAPALTRTRDEATGPQPLEWISKDLGAPQVDLEDKEAVSAILDRRA